MVKFMQILKDELQLMADQIVSISIHDSAVHDGDLEAVVFYRTESAVDNSEPIESLNYTPYEEMKMLPGILSCRKSLWM